VLLVVSAARADWRNAEELAGYELVRLRCGGGRLIER
jgi:hypothetical protein